jgi:hypothetical protein
MARPTLRTQVMQLEVRCTPASLSFWAGLGGGASAVPMFGFVEYPPQPVMPETVTLTNLLPNGNLVKCPPTPIRIATSAITANIPLHILFPSQPVPGLLEAADVNSSRFIPPSPIQGLPRSVYLGTPKLPEGGKPVRVSGEGKGTGPLQQRFPAASLLAR